MKYVVDTCIFNKLIDGEMEPESLPKDGDFIASHIQIEELNKTRDEERRARLFLRFSMIVREVVPTETAIFGISRFDHCKLADGNLYGKLKAELDALNRSKTSNSMDALIAEIAIKNGYRLLTADYHLQKVATNNGCDVLYWET
jgi:hypothetical protein